MLLQAKNSMDRGRVVGLPEFGASVYVVNGKHSD